MFIHEAGFEVVIVDGGGECDGVGDVLLVAAVDVFVLVGLEVLLVAAVVVAGRNLGGGDVSDGHMTPIQTPEIGVTFRHISIAPSNTLTKQDAMHYSCNIFFVSLKTLFTWHMCWIGTHKPGSPEQV